MTLAEQTESDPPKDSPLEEAILEVRDVSVGYDREPVLRNVSLSIGRGEFWFFVGPNGEGKSTLVKAILGALQPRSGSLRLAGSIRRERRIGFVPQSCALRRTLPMTVEDFVVLGLIGLRPDAKRNRGPRQRADDLAWAIETVGLGDLRKRDYWSLSGGQRQRALVARGLVIRPELLLLDEPTNGLDIAAEHALLELFARLNRAETLSLILVTHSIWLAASRASHVALFHEGKVLAGPRDRVLTADALTRIYGIGIVVERDTGGQPVVRARPGQEPA